MLFAAIFGLDLGVQGLRLADLATADAQEQGAADSFHTFLRVAAQAPLLGAIKSRFANDAERVLNRTIRRCVKRNASLHAQRPESKKATG